MTGTYAASLHRNQSRSYLNHLVVIINGQYIFQLQSSHHQAVCVRSKKGNHIPVVYMMLHIPKYLHSPAINSVPYFISPHLETMWQKGSNPGCFWTIDTSGTCAKAVAHISGSVIMEWGFKEIHVDVINFHKCGKSDSQIFLLLKPMKIS